MSVNTTNLINKVSDPTIRQALFHIFNQLKADMDVNKEAFDNHDHDATADQAPLDGSGNPLTFNQNLD